MRLKSLEIQGFKSFPDKTKLEFVDGLTAVVGPNGSGKSNISDAIRWVLGEQSSKTLRGNKMEDVIFTGTQTRKQLGFAQVSLSIDNKERMIDIDSDEVTITRKYYRNGESVFLINNNNVRLKDINEMFMDTGLGKDGYSMIGQGKIAEIVSAKSNERREIFEEAAGISKFRYKKNEAEKKLEAAEENLLRLKDILSELEGRIEPLRIQSEKAKKFITLADEKRILEVSLWVDMLNKSKDVLREQEYKLVAFRQSYDNVNAEIALFEQVLNDIHNSIAACSVSIEDNRTAKQQLDDSAAENESKIAVLGNDIFHNNESIERIKSEIESINTYNLTTIEEIENKKQQLINKKNEIGELQNLILSTEADLEKIALENESVNNKKELTAKDISAKSFVLAQLKGRLLSNDESISEQDLRRELLKQNLEAKSRQLEDANKELDDCDAIIRHLSEEIQNLSNSLVGYELKQSVKTAKRDKIQQKVNEAETAIKEKLHQVSLLKELEKNLEGFAYSVKSVLKASKNGELKGIIGTVSQIIDVDSKYAVAIETAIAGAMQNIVVSNEDSAKRAIEFLKQTNGGRATFLPLTSVKGERMNDSTLKNSEGYIGIAADLVKYDEKYSSIIFSYLGKIVIVEDLDCATAMAKQNGYKFRIVTLDGQVINAGGSYSGGSVSKNSGFLSRRTEIEKIEQEIEKLKLSVKDTEIELKTISEEVSAINAAVSGINAEIAVATQDKIKYEAEKKGLISGRDEIQSSLNALQNDIDSFEKKAKEAIGETVRLKDEISILEDEIAVSQKLQDELRARQEKYLELKEQKSQFLTEQRIAVMSANKDSESIENAINELIFRKDDVGGRVAEHENEINRLIQLNDEKARLIEELIADTAKKRETAAQCEENISGSIQKRQQLEQETTKIREDEKGKISEREKLANEISRYEERKLTVQAEYDNIIFKLLNEYELSRTEACEIALKLDDISAAQKRLGELKSKIKQLGSINVDAIEEYKEVSERYQFLKAQIDDVEKSRDELRKLIYDLTYHMRNIFEDRFRKINSNFSKIFVELFGGGKAELILSNPEDVLESGIEISVTPPGKIIRNLASLSGGEQAFVAIAIYFAILKVKPAPFCILDEIEAALDDVNVNRYAQYLRKLCDNTQFIAITHRRGTMDEADVLYGVTMQEEGVSKLLELKASEVEKKLNLKK